MRSSSAVVAAAAVLLTGCTSPRDEAPAAAPATASAAAPQPVVDVTCTHSGTTVSPQRTAAQPDGVHVRVTDMTGRNDPYLVYRWGTGRGGGDRIPVGSTSRVLSLPPGPASLNCAYDSSATEDTPVKIEVLDPTASWRTGGLRKLGCTEPGLSTISWVIGPGKGATADGALRDLSGQADKPFTWHHVQEGWAEAAEQSYVLERSGEPWVSASVRRTETGTMEANLGAGCGSFRKAAPAG